jgi:hypothetical protein
MRQALEASTDRAAAPLHFLGDLSADEARALEEAYRRLTGQRRAEARASRGSGR